MDGMCGIEYHFLCERLDFPIKKENHRWLVIRRFSCFCGFNASDAVSDGLKLVVPSIFPILTGYVAIMLLANAVLIAFAVKSIKSR